jgi:hypothetical protein
MAKKKTITTRSASQRVAAHVKEVLKKNADFASTNCYMTAYQILQLLPQKVRDRLIKKHGLGGKGASVEYAATEVIAKAAKAVTNDIV